MMLIMKCLKGLWQSDLFMTQDTRGQGASSLICVNKKNNSELYSSFKKPGSP